MWRNRITQFVPSDRNRLSTPAAAAATPCRAPSATAYAAGAFMVPPSAGPPPGLYALAHERAVFELRRRKRTSFLSLN